MLNICVIFSLYDQGLYDKYLAKFLHVKFEYP